MGRRWGKSLGCEAELVKRAIQKRGLYWWMAPTHPQGTVTWDLWHSFVPQALFRSVSSPERHIRLINGSQIYWKSADQKALSGAGLHGLVIDEAAQISKSVWDRDLRPALMDQKGWAILITTPRGRNWVWELFCRGQDPTDETYEAYHFPSHENPYLDPSELDELKQSLSDRMYKQEVLAEFLDDAAIVFRHVKDCATATLRGARPADRNYLGVDLAKQQDFTVLVVVEKLSNEVLYLERFNKIDWGLQKAKIIDVANRYRAQVWVDKTGLGDPIVDDLRKVPGFASRINGYVFTSPSKQRLIENAVIDFDRKVIKIPDNPVLVNELLSYGYEVLPSGRYRFSAPEGLHDDCVMALCLAMWGAKNSVILGDGR